jgi:acyl carrier protein
VRLVGYVVSRGAAAGAEELRDHLRLSLPEYMVPQHITRIDRLPLTPNGKIDRKALPAPEMADTTSTAKRVAPRTETEAQVLAAMEEVLSLPGMGIRDDFFVMGGHSLLAARLTSRLGRQFSVNLPLRTLFESATAEKLARVIDETSGTASVPVQRIKRQADQHEAPLTVMQERIRFMEELHPGRVVYNTPSAHRLKGPMDAVAFERALLAMIERQPSLRTSIERSSAGYVQRVHAELGWRLAQHDLRDVPEAQRSQELMSRMQVLIDQPIDIKVAPLFHSALYRLGEEEHVFLFVPHHIVWDGWSFDLLYEEMSALYPAQATGATPTVPTLEVSYVDFAQWHRQWMGGDDFRKQLLFWKKRFEGVDTPAAIPTDRPRQAGMTGTGAVEWVHVDKALTEQLRAVGRQFDATLNMLTMAVYAGMLRQAVGGSSIVVGIPVRGRLAGELEQVMGFFNNLLPVHLSLDLDAPLAGCVAWVKDQLLDLFANQEVPFERLAEEREIAAAAQKSGLYQALFSFQDARERPRNWGTLRHESVLVMQKGATEDFGLWLMEVPGGLEGGVNYNADLFERQTAELFRDRFIALLSRVVRQPTATMRQLLASPGRDLDRFEAWVSGQKAHAVAVRPGPGVGRSDTRRGKTPAEAELAALWAKLLGVNAEHIQPEDNFFDLGGSSLLVMQAVTESARAGTPAMDPSRYVFEPLSKLAASGDLAPSGEVAADAATAQALAAIWADLLGIDAKHIGPEDNFFDLGGSSLLAMRFVAAAEPVLGQPIDAQRVVYECLRQLAQKAQPRADGPAVVDASAAAESTAGPAPASTGLLSKAIRRFGWRG